MNKKLYVGNLAWAVTEESLQQLFSQHGQVEEAFVMKDKFSGRSKGFAFVTFANEEDAKKAQEALNGTEFEGRKLNIDFARPPKKREDFGGGGDRY